MSYHQATYSPDDNKLRLYPAHRLDAEEYARVKAAGFKWAPKQELFVAPMWTPGREDLLIELCGAIEDEDATLTERAEQRAERFAEYSEKREHDAQAAADGVKQLADNIPFGQPILVGHHSEKRARKDAERIENGMRKAVKMWETAGYWKSRATGAIAHAKYKERPDVRARRIKKIEADKRRNEKNTKESALFIKLWSNLENADKWKAQDGHVPTLLERALAIANRDYISRCFPLADFPRQPPASQYEGPMSYWSALDGGIITPEQARDMAIKVHERAQEHRARWLAHYENRLVYERAMLGESGGTVADQKGPEKGGACRCWAAPRNGWAYIQKVNKVSVTLRETWDGARVFTRTVPFDKLVAVMTAAEVKEARDAGRLVEIGDNIGFHLVKTPETPPAETTCKEPEQRGQEIAAMKETLKQGIRVEAVPQLFTTPKELAERVANLADVRPGHRVLEPSAGTGMLLGALGCRMFGRGEPEPRPVAVEINAALADKLRQEFPLTDVINGDFLQCNGDLGTFDRIIMNPPFKNGEDIKHIEHAAAMLRPGGRLVAICANGPRQREKLRPGAKQWEDLPAGSFASQGTAVNAALVVIERNEREG